MADEEIELSAKDRAQRFVVNHYKGILVIVFPAILSPCLVVGNARMNFLYLLLLMACYWITNCIPLAVTALLPLALYPFLNVMGAIETCIAYFNDISMTYLLGLIIAITIEYCGLHRRIAYAIMLLIGCNPRRLHLAMMLFTMILSMWFTNLNSTLIICPIVHGMLEEFEQQNIFRYYIDEDPNTPDDTVAPVPTKSTIAFYLGVVYAASAGGTMSLLGTNTNIIVGGVLEKAYPDVEINIGFAIFPILYLVPFIIATVLFYLYLQILLMGMFRASSEEKKAIDLVKETKDIAKAAIREKFNALGKLTLHEIQVLCVFIIMIILLLTRPKSGIAGYSNLVDIDMKGSFAVVIPCLMLFAIPTNYMFFKYCALKRPAEEKAAPSLISWKYFHSRMQWGLLLLNASANALYAGAISSGCTSMIKSGVADAFHNCGKVGVQVAVIWLMIVLTQLFPNASLASMGLPIVCTLASGKKIHPLYLVLPASTSINQSYMMPVASPCNAIAMQYSQMRISRMLLIGIIPTLIGGLFVMLISQSTLSMFFDLDTFPDWAGGVAPIPTDTVFDHGN